MFFLLSSLCSSMVFFLCFFFVVFSFHSPFLGGLFLSECFCVPDHIFRCSCHHYHHHRHRVNGHLCVLPILLWLLWIVVVVVVFSCFFFCTVNLKLLRFLAFVGSLFKLVVKQSETKGSKHCAKKGALMEGKRRLLSKCYSRSQMSQCLSY